MLQEQPRPRLSRVEGSGETLLHEYYLAEVEIGSPKPRTRLYHGRVPKQLLSKCDAEAQAVCPRNPLVHASHHLTGTWNVAQAVLTGTTAPRCTFIVPQRLPGRASEGQKKRERERERGYLLNCEVKLLHPAASMRSVYFQGGLPGSAMFLDSPARALLASCESSSPCGQPPYALVLHMSFCIV